MITKFKSRGLYTTKIKYWNAIGSGFPTSIIPALQNIGISHHKKTKLPKLLQPVYIVYLVFTFLQNFQFLLQDIKQNFMQTRCIKSQINQPWPKMILCIKNCSDLLRKYCSNDREKLKAEGQNFAKVLRWLRPVKVKHNFECSFNLFLEESRKS